MTERFYTTEDVARLLQVTRAPVRAWIRQGRLPASRFGRGWRITPADLDAFRVRSRAQPSGEPPGG